MLKREIEITGKTDDKGQFFIYGMDEVNDFFRKHPNKKIVGEFRVFETGSSPAMIGYYKTYVLKTFQDGYYKLGYRYFIEEVDRDLRNMSTVCKRGRGDLDPLRVEDLTNAELVEYLDELKELGAEHFGIVIYDPRV